MKVFKFENGDQVEDIISGKKGTITARCDYFNGCIQYQVKPKGVNKDDGKTLASSWIDQEQLKLQSNQKRLLPISKQKEPVGGPHSHPAPRR